MKTTLIKKYLFALGLALLAATGWAGRRPAIIKHTQTGSTVKGKGKIPSTYHSMLRPGKVWVTVGADGTETHFYNDGDTLIGDWECMRLYSQCGSQVTYRGALCEEGLQTGFISPGDDKAFLLYDFGMEPDDTVRLYSPYSDEVFDVTVQWKTEVREGEEKLTQVAGHFPYRQAVLSPDSTDTIYFTWTEGVGADSGILAPCEGAIPSRLKACYDNGRCIYKDGHPVDSNEVDSIGFLTLKNVDNILNFNRLVNGTEATLTLSNDTVWQVDGSTVYMVNGNDMLVILNNSRPLTVGQVFSGEITGRKEFVGGRPVLVCTDDLSAVRDVTLIRRQTATAYSLGGQQTVRKGIVVNRGRKTILK